MFDDVLDLLERAPEPVMRVDPSRIISAGNRTRRRRRRLTLMVSAAAAIGIAGSSIITGWGPASTGHDPGEPCEGDRTDHLDLPDHLAPRPPTTPSDVAETGAEQTWGPVHVMSQQRNRQGQRPALYLTPDRMFCIGTVDAEGAVTPSVCRQIKAPPPDDFGTGYAWSMDGDLPTGAAANEFAAGTVARDITKVVVRTERGDVTAHLTRAPDPDLGQFYWVGTACRSSPQTRT